MLYGLDYTASDQDRQHEMVREAIMEHVKFHPQSLIVVEEYDKLDCPTRGLLKQLIDSSSSTNVTINRYFTHCVTPDDCCALQLVSAKFHNDYGPTTAVCSQVYHNAGVKCWVLQTAPDGCGRTAEGAFSSEA